MYAQCVLYHMAQEINACGEHRFLYHQIILDIFFYLSRNRSILLLNHLDPHPHACVSRIGHQKVLHTPSYLAENHAGIHDIDLPQIFLTNRYLVS